MVSYMLLRELLSLFIFYPAKIYLKPLVTRNLIRYRSLNDFEFDMFFVQIY